jgi:hypothetical protein
METGSVTRQQKISTSIPSVMRLIAKVQMEQQAHKDRREILG